MHEDQDQALLSIEDKFVKKMKRLQELTNEELWELFPIILSPHDKIWAKNFQEEKLLIIAAVGTGNIVRISHIGSTAIPALIAKPTVDILMEIPESADLEELIRSLEYIGYIYSQQPDKPAPHMLFMKGYTPEGFAEKVFHLHIRYPGDWDEFYFRDFLISHPDEVQEYGKLKEYLKSIYEHDRDAYTEAKSDFINRIVGRARSTGGT